MTFVIDQNMLFVAIFISVIVDVSVKPFIKKLKEEIRAGISRIILIALSVLVMFFLNKSTYVIDGIVTSVLSMLFYDVAGYSFLKKKVKEKLSSSDMELK